jgi:uncharacterized membrane protein YkvA (DUF1232 family)
MSQGRTPSNGSLSRRSSAPPAPSPERVWSAVADATRMVLRRRFRVLLLVRDAYDRLVANQDPFRAIANDVRDAMRLLVAWAKRSYDGVSWGALVLLVGALSYFVLPTDLVPDLLPGVGFIDDVTVISTAIQSVRTELDRFRDWEE